LERIGAEWLEKAVWEKFTGVFNDPSVLKESIRGALEALKQRRQHLQAGSKPIAEELERVKGKTERLALVFADGAISEELYRARLGELKGQEGSLRHRMDNMNPEVTVELAELERWISTSEKMLTERFTKTFVTSSGIYAVYEPPEGNISIVPLGYNLREKVKLEENEGQSTISTKADVDAILAIVPPIEFFETGYLRETLAQNKREILRAFGVKVYAYPDRVEVKGFIPEQTIRLPSAKSNGGRDTQSDCLPE